MDGQSTDDPNAFDYGFATKPIGGRARRGAVRGGKGVEINGMVEGGPEAPPQEPFISSPSPVLGPRATDLSPALADDLRLDAGAQGVVIVDIANGSPAQSLGFQRGDLVLSVNNAKIAKTRDLERIAGQQIRMWRITIMRGGQQMSVELRG